jgi:hypothetical protein
MISAMRTQLLAHASIDTVEPYLRDDTALPAVLFEVQTEERERDLQSGSALRMSQIDCRCLSATYSGVDTLASAVQTQLDGWSDSGNNVQASTVVSVDRSFDTDNASANDMIFEAVVSIQIWWEN